MSEETPAPGAAPEEPAKEAPEAESSAEATGAARAVPLEAVPTRDLLVWILGILGAKAWQGMGLVPNPASGKIEKDLGEARIAIDAFSAVLDAIRPHLEAQARQDTEALLTTLRLNFVEKSGGS